MTTSIGFGLFGSPRLGRVGRWALVAACLWPTVSAVGLMLEAGRQPRPTEED